VFDEVEKFRVVHLEEHTSDLSGELTLSPDTLVMIYRNADDSLVDQRVKSFTEHLLLLNGVGSGQRLGRESGSLSRSGSLVLGSNRHLRTSGSVGGESLGNTDGRGSTVGSLSTRSGRRSSSRSGVVGGHSTVRSSGGHTVRHGRHTGLAIRSVSGSVLHHLGSTGVSHHRTTSHGHHVGLTVSRHGRVAVDGLTHVTGTHGSTRVTASVLSLRHLGLESLSSDVLSLGESDVQGLGTDHLAVHLRDSLGSLIGRRVADETKVLGSTLVVLHDSAAGDCSEGVELGSESLIIPLVVEVLDVKVDTGRLGLLLGSSLLVTLLEFVVSLGSLLSSAGVKLLSLELLLVQLINSLGSGLVVDIVDETETGD